MPKHNDHGPQGVHHPSLRPLWIRIAFVAACFGWGGVEIWLGNPLWSAAIIAVGLWLAYHFFVTFPKDD